MAYTPDTVLDLSNPADWAYYTNAVKAKESGGDPTIKNPDSSATGLYQFTKPTWDQFGDGGNITDPAAQEAAMRKLTSANASALGSRGHAVTARNLYLSHFLGSGDAPDVLDAAKSSPTDAASEYVQDNAVSSNPSVLGGGKTVQDVLNWAGNRFGGAAPATVAPRGALSAFTPDPIVPASSLAGSLYGAITGGPGALSAVDGNGETPLNHIGSGFTGLGAALMARDNPAGAAVLNSSLNSDTNRRVQMAQLAMQKQRLAQSKTDATSDTVLAKTSTGVLKQKPDGSTYVVPIPKSIQEADDNSLPTKLQPLYQQNVTGLQKSMDLDKRFGDLQEQLATGQFSVGLDSQGKYWVKNISNNSSDGAEKAKNMTAAINSAIEDVMNANKGAGAEWKYKLARDSLLPSGGEYDNAQTLSALGRIRQLNDEKYGGFSRGMKQLEGQYDLSKSAPDGSWSKHIQAYEDARDKRDQEVISPAIEQFHKNKAASASGLTPAQQIKQLYKPQ